MRKVARFIFAVAAAVAVIPAEVLHYGVRLVPCHGGYRAGQMTAARCPVESGQLLLLYTRPRPHSDVTAHVLLLKKSLKKQTPVF